MSGIGYDGGVTCALQCRDLDGAVRWYQDVLGFTCLYKMDDIAWAELSTDIKGVNVGLSQVENPTVEGGATLTWGVKDIDAARATLEARDVKFDGDTMTIPDMVRLATFYDPDGNKMMLYQDMSPKS